MCSSFESVRKVCSLASSAPSVMSKMLTLIKNKGTFLKDKKELIIEQSTNKAKNRKFGSKDRKK